MPDGNTNTNSKPKRKALLILLKTDLIVPTLDELIAIEMT
jgi:hypothetical protein